MYILIGECGCEFIILNKAHNTKRKQQNSSQVHLVNGFLVRCVCDVCGCCVDFVAFFLSRYQHSPKIINKKRHNKSAERCELSMDVKVYAFLYYVRVFE